MGGVRASWLLWAFPALLTAPSINDAHAAPYIQQANVRAMESPRMNPGAWLMCVTWLAQYVNHSEDPCFKL
jgi:hypothetical protein